MTSPRVFFKNILSTTSPAQLENALVNAGFGEGLLEARIPRKGEIARQTFSIAYVHYQTEDQVQRVVDGVDNTFLGDVSTQRVRCEVARPRDYVQPRAPDPERHAHLRVPMPPSTPPPDHLMRPPPPPPEFPPEFPEFPPGPRPPPPRPSAVPSVREPYMGLQNLARRPSMPSFAQPSMAPAFASRPPAVPRALPPKEVPAVIEENAALASKLAKQTALTRQKQRNASMSVAPKTPPKAPPTKSVAPKTPPKGPPPKQPATAAGEPLGQPPKVGGPQAEAEAPAPKVRSETAMVPEENRAEKETEDAPLFGHDDDDDYFCDQEKELQWYNDQAKLEDQVKLEHAEEGEESQVATDDPYQYSTPVKDKSSSEPPTPKPFNIFL